MQLSTLLKWQNDKKQHFTALTGKKAHKTTKEDINRKLTLRVCCILH